MSGDLRYVSRFLALICHVPIGSDKGEMSSLGSSRFERIVDRQQFEALIDLENESWLVTSFQKNVSPSKVISNVVFLPESRSDPSLWPTVSSFVSYCFAQLTQLLVKN